MVVVLPYLSSSAEPGLTGSPEPEPGFFRSLPYVPTIGQESTRIGQESIPAGSDVSP